MLSSYFGCKLQVVCAIVIFTCGVLRIIWHAKWSLGVELAYAVVVFITAAIGIYASSRRLTN